MLKLVEWYAQTASALLAAKQKADPRGWQDFQEAVHALKNQRTRALREAEDLQASIFAADTALRLQKEGAIGEPHLCMGHLVCVSPSLLCAACCRALLPQQYAGKWTDSATLFCCTDEDDGEAVRSGLQGLNRECRIVLISGFESFNVDLYKKARLSSLVYA